jgi:hypothetical protein
MSSAVGRRGASEAHSGADIRVAFDTQLARAARDGGVHRYGLAFAKAFYSWPDCLDGTGELVAEDERRGRHALADVAVAKVVDI